MLPEDELNITIETQEVEIKIDNDMPDVELTIDSPPDVMTVVPSDELNVKIESKEIELKVDKPNVELTLDVTPDVIILAAGSVGAIGPMGPTGPRGPTGPQGIPGADSSVPGPAGPQGPEGIQGPIGPQGDEGIEGPAGPPGPGRVLWEYMWDEGGEPPTGSEVRSDNAAIPESITKLWVRDQTADGQNARNVLMASEPGSHIGIQDKDDATKAYRFLLSGPPIGKSGYVEFPVSFDERLNTLAEQRVIVAISVPSEPGPAGPQGPPGPTGEQGAVGPQGPAGADSTVPGPQGPEGPEGPQGDVGPTGPTGSTGPTGPAGSTGPQGDIGPIGPTGPAGPMKELAVSSFGNIIAVSAPGALVADFGIVAFDGLAVVIELAAGFIDLRTNSNCALHLYDFITGSDVLVQRLGYWREAVTTDGSGHWFPVYVVNRFTPSAGNHRYRIRFQSDAGFAALNQLESPNFARIVKAA